MHEQTINALNDGHRTLKHVLSLLRFQLDILAPEAHRDSFKFINNAISYMSTFSGLVHHPAEELIFERLVGYAPHTAPLCAQLAEQHDSFKTQEIAIMDRLSGKKANEAVRCRWIKKAGSCYCDDNEDHMDTEESKAFPHAIKWLKVADWDEIQEQSRFDLDPLTDPGILARYDNVYDYIMDSSESFTRH